MTCVRGSVAIVALLALLCSAGHARISVQRIDGCCGSIDEQELVNGKWRIRLTSTDNSSPTQWRIQATQANEKIEYIRVFNNSSAGQSAGVRIEHGTGTFDSIDEVSRINNTRVMVIFMLRVDGNVGIINTTNLVDSDIRGNCLGPVTAVERAGGELSVITKLKVAGNLLGSVTAPYGYVDEVDVGGDIGSTFSVVNIFARDNIRRILAGGSIYATIDANQYNVTGDIGRIGSAGSVVTGSIKCDRFTTFTGVTDPGLFVTGGSLSADVTMQSVMDRKIIVAGSLNADADINLPDAGLVGQVIFNASNTSGTWAGKVFLNNVQLSNEPEYMNTASAVGGGSAGVARFTIHDESCKPVTGTTTTGYGVDPSSIIEDPPCTYYFTSATLRFYGPVTPTNTGTGTACDVTVELDTGGGYADVTSDFKTLPVASTGDREIKIERDNGTGWPLGT